MITLQIVILWLQISFGISQSTQPQLDPSSLNVSASPTLLQGTPGWDEQVLL